MFAFRDPHGIRPLVLGHRKNDDGEDEWSIASEDAALAPIGFERVRDVRPGEAILITTDGQLLTEQCLPGSLNPCIFEYIYLARPDSTINEIPVYEFQLNLGASLFASFFAFHLMEHGSPAIVVGQGGAWRTG